MTFVEQGEEGGQDVSGHRVGVGGVPIFVGQQVDQRIDYVQVRKFAQGHLEVVQVEAVKLFYFRDKLFVYKLGNLVIVPLAPIGGEGENKLEQGGKVHDLPPVEVPPEVGQRIAV